MELAGGECRRLQAAGAGATVILAVLEHFKAVNDTHGHAAETPRSKHLPLNDRHCRCRPARSQRLGEKPGGQRD
ncbi:hypothetical protein ACSBOX_08605 [Arthrobacter sp. KN11-1C]|uniref:hypothetical protein n=1 Tax=Arthrobacter sp. KN11-1C TaxID=3445774 RepID=UPI003FA15A50